MNIARLFTILLAATVVLILLLYTLYRPIAAGCRSQPTPTRLAEPPNSVPAPYDTPITGESAQVYTELTELGTQIVQSKPQAALYYQRSALCLSIPSLLDSARADCCAGLLLQGLCGAEGWLCLAKQAFVMAETVDSLGMTYLGDIHFREGVWLLNRAIAVDPIYPEARQLRADISYECGDYWQALEDLSQLLASSPRDSLILTKRAYAWLGVGNITAAQRDLYCAAAHSDDGSIRESIAYVNGLLSSPQMHEK